MVKNKRSLFRVMLMFVLTLLLAVPLTFADKLDNTDTANKDSKHNANMFNEENRDFNKDFEFDPETDSAVEDFLIDIFMNDKYGEYEVSAAVSMAQPFVIFAMTITLFVLIITFFLFVSQTAVDLAAILVPITRSFLMKRTAEHGTNSGMNNGGQGNTWMCLSDAAMEVLGGSSGSSMGGGYGGYGGQGSDRGSSGSKLWKYTKAKSVEMMVFVIFALIFFTPIIGFIIIQIYKFGKMFLQGFVNI